jgi:GAF domain-containing protein
MNTNYYPTLRTRLAAVLVALAAIFAAAVSSVIYVDFKNELRSNLRHRLENITTLASLQQNGDELLQVQAQGDEFFNKIQDRNAGIKRSDSDLIFVYTLRKDSQGIYFVVDARVSPDEEDISNFGDRYEEPSDTLVANFNTMTKTIVEPEIYTDEFGSFLSGYAPIYDANGQRVGVLGVDISADTIVAQERQYLIRLILIFLASLPVVVIGGVIFAAYLAKPIVNLRDMANKISQGNFNTRITRIPQTRELAELATDLNAMAGNLGGLINDLENRVNERTAGLTQKTDQLRAASFIARQTAEIQELDTILKVVAGLVTDQFGFYHTGIFLVNEIGDEVVLVAASSDGGKRMVEKGHSLEVGQGVVGSAAARKKPRIALDVGPDAVLFNNPDLPMTRSEVALPLMVRERVVGVLDVQSDQPMAFNIEEIDVLQTMADQVAVAIENTRLLAESKAALLQVEALTASRTREAWSQRAQAGNYSYSYTPLGIRAGKSSDESNEALKIPIVLRGQKIGSISVARKDEASWNQMDKDLINEVAYQTGLAIDNVRLVEDATQRARQEQTVGELATRFSQSMDIDSLLQTAARELGQVADVAEVSVFIGEIPEQAPQKRRSKRGTG